MDKKKIRKADFITSFLLMAFGIFVVVESLRMPMKASYGGVESLWYVSPALFPLFVGSMLIILGLTLMVVAIKAGGMKALFARQIIKHGIVISEKTSRTLTVAFALGSFIYIFIPRVDFFISISTFLFFLTTVFYPENKKIKKRLTSLFVIETTLYFILIITGVWEYLYGVYVYTFDILAIMFFITMVITANQIAKKENVDKDKIRTTLWLSLIVPAFLCPVFRYPLRTPLPHEGLIIDYMNLIVFKFRYRG